MHKSQYNKVYLKKLLISEIYYKKYNAFFLKVYFADEIPSIETAREPERESLEDGFHLKT